MDNLFVLLTIKIVLLLFTSALSCVALNADIKQYDIKNKNLWLSFAFFFGWFALIIYLIVRKKLIKKAQGDVEIKKPNRLFVILLIAVLLLTVSANVYENKTNTMAKLMDYAVTNFLTGDSEEFEHKSFSPANADEISYFYDMNKKPYINTHQVPYYTSDGEEYVFEKRDGIVGLKSTKTNEFHKSNECFVGKDGYVFFDSSLSDEVLHYDHSVEKDGEVYYLAGYVSWDNDGYIISNNGGYIFVE